MVKKILKYICTANLFSLLFIKLLAVIINVPHVPVNIIHPTDYTNEQFITLSLSLSSITEIDRQFGQFQRALENSLLTLSVLIFIHSLHLILNILVPTGIHQTQVTCLNTLLVQPFSNSLDNPKIQLVNHLSIISHCLESPIYCPTLATVIIFIYW